MSKAYRLKNMTLDELSLVDRPANTKSKVAIWKRRTGPDKDRIRSICKSYLDGQMQSDFNEALAEEMKFYRSMEVEEKLWPLMSALRESIMSTTVETTGEDRDSKIRENVEAFLSAVRSAVDGEPMEKAMSKFKKAMHGDEDMTEAEKNMMQQLMDKEGMTHEDARNKVMGLRKTEDSPDANAGSPGDNPSNDGDDMSEELKKELGDLRTQIDQLTKQVEAHGLTVTKADDGSVSVQKNEQEYVEFNGEKIAKSALPEPVLKHLESQNEEIRKMQERQEKEDLRKRADSEIPHLKGTPDQRGALLKAVDGIKDEETRKAVTETLKAADGFAKASFSEIGKSASEDDSSATARLNKMAKERAESKNEDFATAYAEVSKSGEGLRLFRESRAESKSN